tara:strand:- start:95 stop:757 length:663 start_codon:yes stop_codon:yes gene_type:complete
MPNALVFDLDGTLVDTAPDLAGALNAVLAAAERKTLEISDVRPLMTQGAVALIREGFKITGAPLDETKLELARSMFLDHYGTNIAANSKPFPGVPETLETLATVNTLGVCTNKPEKLSIELLNALNLSKFFSAIVGGDSLSVRKPDPHHLWATIEAINATPAETVMIGDSTNDVETARDAGVPIVAVSYGYRDRPAEMLDADIVIDSFSELPNALNILSH